MNGGGASMIGQSQDGLRSVAMSASRSSTASRAERMFLLVPAQALVARWLESFREFPPRQEPSSFGIDEVMEKLTASAAGMK